MDVEISINSEEIINYLSDRIECIERTLSEDEDFCNEEIDATYQAAKKFFEHLQIRFNEKLTELEQKLDHSREENVQLSEKNKKQFDEEIDEINQLFSSGKHQEALEKFSIYEQSFQQRATLIENIPKIYMNNLDINQYFSIDKPIITPLMSLNVNKQNSVENLKQTKTESNNKQETFQPCYDIRYKQSENQQILTNNTSLNKEPPSSRSYCFSTRLSTSSSNQSLPVIENEMDSPTLMAHHRSSRENINNYKPAQSTPTSPNIIRPLVQKQLSVIKMTKGDGLSPTLVVPYQYERNTSILLTCNQNSFVLFRNQSDRLNRWYSTVYNSSDSIIQDPKPHNLYIKSIGFIDRNHIYLFTEREFLIYSSDLLTKHYSCILLNDTNYNLEYHNIHLGFGGLVYDQFIYHIYLNLKHHFILSLLELETNKHLQDYDLTELFPDVRQFINFCIYEQNINFLVEMEGSQYAVLYCTINNSLKIEFKRSIHLSYAGKPLTICPMYIPYLEKMIFFINDPSAKIIHIITNEKYLKSSSITAYALSYIKENHELILVLNDGIYSININEQKNFFLKFH